MQEGTGIADMMPVLGNPAAALEEQGLAFLMSLASADVSRAHWQPECHYATEKPCGLPRALPPPPRAPAPGPSSRRHITQAIGFLPHDSHHRLPCALRLRQ